MYLVDTNILLEILLGQTKKEACKDFIRQNVQLVVLSDFSVHSIGVIMLKNNKGLGLQVFYEKFLPYVTVATLPSNGYAQIVDNAQKYLLDFDDAYQYTLAKRLGFKLLTLDKHLKKMKDIQVVGL